MLESLITQLLNQAGWIGALVTAIQFECQAASRRINEIRQNLLVSLCLWALGFIFVAISLVSFAATLVMIWGREYPLQSLLLVSVIYAGAGFLLIQKSIRRVS